MFTHRKKKKRFQTENKKSNRAVLIIQPFVFVATRHTCSVFFSQHKGLFCVQVLHPNTPDSQRLSAKWNAHFRNHLFTVEGHGKENKIFNSRHLRVSIVMQNKVLQWNIILKAKTIKLASTLTSTTSDNGPHRPTASIYHPHNRPIGGDKRPQLDTERIHCVYQMRRDRHSQLEVEEGHIQKFWPRGMTSGTDQMMSTSSLTQV